MWKSLTKLITPAIQTNFLVAESLLQQQLRTTFILKRRVPPFLHKKGLPPKKFRTRHYVYDFVQQTETEKQPDIDLILTQYVDGLGNIGDRITVKPRYGYEQLLLPGLALYATPENSKQYENVKKEKVVQYSSPNVHKTIEVLNSIQVSVVMNKDSPWTVQPWHIRASLRKCGFIVPEDAIELPQPEIKGPNLDYEGKEFYVTITINHREKAEVRCRLHHWSTKIVDRLPYQEEFWKRPTEPIFQEHAPVLDKLPNKCE